MEVRRDGNPSVGSSMSAEGAVEIGHGLVVQVGAIVDHGTEYQAEGLLILCASCGLSTFGVIRGVQEVILEASPNH